MTEVCGICTEELCDESCDLVYKTPCDHVFHVSCLERWFGRNKSCPLCRAKINIRTVFIYRYEVIKCDTFPTSAKSVNVEDEIPCSYERRRIRKGLGDKWYMERMKWIEYENEPCYCDIWEQIVEFTDLSSGLTCLLSGKFNGKLFVDDIWLMAITYETIPDCLSVVNSLRL